MKWAWIVFDEPEAADEPGCDICGLEVGNDGRIFYQPRYDTATDADAGLMRELMKHFGCDASQVWICSECREKLEDAAKESDADR